MVSSYSNFSILGSVSVLLLLSCSGVHSVLLMMASLMVGDHTLVWLDLELGVVLEEDYQRTILSLFSCIVPLVLCN